MTPILPTTARSSLGFSIGMSVIFTAEVLSHGGATKFGGRFGTITLGLGLFLIAAAVYAAGFLAVELLKAGVRRGRGTGPSSRSVKSGEARPWTVFLPGLLLGAVVQWSGLNWLAFRWRGTSLEESWQILLLFLTGAAGALMTSWAGPLDTPARAGVPEASDKNPPR